MPEDPKGSLDLLSQTVSFLRSDAGLVGIALAFIAALYFGALHWGKDYDKLEKRMEKAEADLATSAIKNAQLEQMVSRLTGLLERATSGFERTVVSRVAEDEGIGYEDAMERVAKTSPTRSRANEQYPKQRYTQRQPLGDSGEDD